MTKSASVNARRRKSPLHFISENLSSIWNAAVFAVDFQQGRNSLRREHCAKSTNFAQDARFFRCRIFFVRAGIVSLNSGA
jgi:hypothetical protein